MPQLAVYEQPLNERIRTLLRLEFLFAQVEVGLGGESEWDSRLAVAGIIDILALLAARTDLRSEIVKELDRLGTVLGRLEDSPGVDHDKLYPLLQRCRELSSAMHSLRGLPGGELKEHELLLSVMQRSGIPGGTCAFDLPVYQSWLLQAAPARQVDIEQWLAPLANIRDAAALILGVVRDSARGGRKLAVGGNYQHNLERQDSVQLIRVGIPASSVFPEISGSKHFFTVRFLERSDTGLRPSQVQEDVDFRLSLCGL